MNKAFSGKNLGRLLHETTGPSRSYPASADCRILRNPLIFFLRRRAGRPETGFCGPARFGIIFRTLAVLVLKTRAPTTGMERTLAVDNNKRQWRYRGFCVATGVWGRASCASGTKQKGLPFGVAVHPAPPRATRQITGTVFCFAPRLGRTTPTWIQPPKGGGIGGFFNKGSDSPRSTNKIQGQCRRPDRGVTQNCSL